MRAIMTHTHFNIGPTVKGLINILLLGTTTKAKIYYYYSNYCTRISNTYLSVGVPFASALTTESQDLRVRSKGRKKRSTTKEKESIIQLVSPSYNNIYKINYFIV